MIYVKWALRILFWVVAVGLLHYTLPQTDMVRITDTNTKRIDFTGFNAMFYSSPSSRSAEKLQTRDIYFIHGIRRNGRPIVYRNEDTGWGWPPYFKFDTADLYTRAGDLISDAEDPKWVAVRHYGWRIRILSVFPNATSLRLVDNPDKLIVPWLSMLILAGIVAVYWMIRVRWVRFRKNRIDPLLDKWTR
ncbi:MAG: DUF1523 family protein [Roseovarius sp.]|nr:DUF1523 family protein [Roseovarius sp.]